MNRQFLNCFSEVTPIPSPVELTVSGKEYVYFGEENTQPQIYYDLYSDCYILQSAINAVTDYVCGSGFEDGLTPQELVINRQGETIYSLISRLAMDYVIFGSFSVQVIRNKRAQIVELNYLDVRNVRLSDDGLTVFYNKNWGKYTRNVRKYPRFDSFEAQDNSIFFYKSPKSRGIYGTPIWSSALREIVTLVEASKANYSDISNGFSPNVLISFNNGTPPQDVQDDIERSIIEKFTTSSGNKIMLSFSDSRESAPEISTFSAPDYTERYRMVLEVSRDAILAAFRVSGQLLGVMPEQTGFNAVEYEQSFKVFNKTVIQPIQREIESAMSILGFDFKLKPFEIKFNDDENNTETI